MASRSPRTNLWRCATRVSRPTRPPLRGNRARRSSPVQGVGTCPKPALPTIPRPRRECRRQQDGYRRPKWGVCVAQRDDRSHYLCIQTYESKAVDRDATRVFADNGRQKSECQSGARHRKEPVQAPPAVRCSIRHNPANRNAYRAFRHRGKRVERGKNLATGDANRVRNLDKLRVHAQGACAPTRRVRSRVKVARGSCTQTRRSSFRKVSLESTSPAPQRSTSRSELRRRTRSSRSSSFRP